MRFVVEIVVMPDKPPRKPEIIATYDNVEARSLKDASYAGVERFRTENPARDMTAIIGRSRLA
jgi:hypothetical protein